MGATRPVMRLRAAADRELQRAATRRSVAAAGPLVIVAAVLVVLRGFAFGDRLTDAHPDILTFWLPRLSFLGRSIAAGHVPLWNPYEMAGHRFAADPQAGWLYLLPMTLFSQLSPATAMRVFIVANPIIAGLALWWFARIEGLSHLAATAAGLSLAMMMATSEIAISMPFAGATAWTCVALVGAAGFRRALRWPARIAWLALGALGWSQVATAHLSHGLVICTALVASYLLAGAVVDRRGSSPGWAALVRAACFLLALPLLSLAILVPRVDALRASSLAAGYDRLGDAIATLGGSGGSIQSNGVWAGWPLAFGAAPGAYAGAAILLGVPLALRARRRRALVWGFGGALALTWVLMLDAVVTAPWVRDAVLRIPFGDVYLHNPGRMRYLALIAIPVLGAVGIQGLKDDPLPRSKVLRWLAAGALLWLGAPLLAFADPVRFVLLAGGILASGWALTQVAGARWRWAPIAAAAVLTIELSVSGVLSHASQPGQTIELGLEGGAHPNLIPQPLPPPTVDASAFTTPTSFVARLAASSERYLTWAPPASSYEKGYLFMQLEPDWPALAMQRGTLFGVHDALGYNPVQSPRYWSFMRARSPLPIFYNAAVIDVPTLRDVRVLGVRYLVVPTGVTPPVDGRIVERADGYDLVEIEGWQARTSVVSDFRVVPSVTGALRTVLAPTFDPSELAVLEHDPGIRPGEASGLGSSTYAEHTPESVTVETVASSPSIVVIRTTYDEGWTATVDGEPTEVLATDGFLMGVAVEPGTHTVRLQYRDDALARGAVAGAAAWGIVAAAWVAAVITGRRQPRPQRDEVPPSTPLAGDAPR